MEFIEVYSKNIEDDSDYNPQIADIRDDVSIYLNQIRNLFSAEAGTVLGAFDMGIMLEHMIYETSISSKNLEKIIIEQLAKYASLYYKFKTNISVKFTKGVKRDIVFIDILINNRKMLELRLT